jgi:hypothetical protein
MNRDFASARKAYESACGSQSNEPDKKWVLDVDWVDWDLSDGWDDDQNALKIKRDQLINEIIRDVQTCVADTGRDDTIWTLPTKNGMHIITRPFNPTAFFGNVWHKVVIQKNNPTILYMP